MKRIWMAVLGVILATHTYAQPIIGPFLQQMTPTGVHVKWETDYSGVGKVQVRNLENNSLTTFTDTQNTQLHDVAITGLEPGISYNYSISVNNADDFYNRPYFNISIPQNPVKDGLRIVALGDCGTGTSEQALLQQQLVQFTSRKKADALLLLGDNAYYAGLKNEYKSKFFDVYGTDLLPSTTLWPAPGNHDYGDNTFSYPYYFDLFTLPTNAESGGLASLSESYYAYNIGDVHFISLDSFGSADGKRMSDSTSKQFRWLVEDLKQNKQNWTIVYFHHPPFSLGSHNADQEAELTAIRKTIVPVFDKYKVDLVLTGHSHTYERSYPIKNFNGISAEFKADLHATSLSNGFYNLNSSSCAYTQSEGGTIYCVAGASGWTGKTSEGFPHKAMANSNATDVGAVILDFKENKMTFTYLNARGQIKDQFVKFRGVNTTKDFEINCGEPLQLAASWEGEYLWSNARLRSRLITVDSLTSDTQFRVSDRIGCLTDTFNVKVRPFASVNAGADLTLLEGQTLRLAGVGVDSLSAWILPSNLAEKGKEYTLLQSSVSNTGNYVFINEYKNCFSSDTVFVQINPILGVDDNSADYKVYPNPASLSVQFSYLSKNDESAILKLTNLQGKVFLEKNIQLTKGPNTGSLDLSNFQQGSYILSIKERKHKIIIP